MKRLLLLLSALAVLSLPAGAAGHRRHRDPPPPPGTRVSVQPIEGTAGPAIRSLVARILRARGYRTTLAIPRVEGTGQYLTLARDNRVTAFVSADLEERKTRSAVTFLIWDGQSGNVLGRWSASGAPKRLPRAVAKGFWKHLAKAFQAAQPPPSTELPPAPPMYIDASSAHDDKRQAEAAAPVRREWVDPFR